MNGKVKRRLLHLGLDVPMIVIVLTLVLFGLLMLYSASWEYSVSIMGERPSFLFEKQLKFLALGLCAAAVLTFWDYQKLKPFVVPAMILTLILLLVIFYLGEIRLGAIRGLFAGSVQPSELAKIVVILYLSFWLSSKQEKLHLLSFGLIPLAAILGVTGSLILLQPDLSAAATIVVIGGLMFFMAGGEIRQIIPSIFIMMIVGLIVILVFSTGRERLGQFMQGLQDPMSASYHVKRAFEAIVRGGFWGVGIGRSTTKFTGLPVAPTDSIFVIIVEETGLIGAGFVLLLFLAFLWRGLTIAHRAPDALGRLLVAGISVWIFLEAIINMSVLVNILPFAGNALPFISYGGSNLVTVLAATGLIQSVARVSAFATEEEGRPLNAVVDLRRNDGWRGVSRSRNSAGIQR